MTNGRQSAQPYRASRALGGDHCECARCGEPFSSSYSFDTHRNSRHGIDRRCLSPAEMVGIGMVQNAGGWWISKRRQDARCGADIKG